MNGAAANKLQSLASKYGAKFYCVYDWELTEEEQKKIESAEIGDDVQIETPIAPVVLADEGGYFIGMFTDKTEIPKEFKRAKAIQLERIENILMSCKASAIVLKANVGLVLNPFTESDENFSFNMEEVDELYFGLINNMEK